MNPIENFLLRPFHRLSECRALWRVVWSVLLYATWLTVSPSVAAGDINVRTLAYNVMQDRWGSPAVFAAALRPLGADIVLRAVQAQGFHLAGRELLFNANLVSSIVAKFHHGLIDHILYWAPAPARASAGGVVTLRQPLSDHHPVWAQLHFEVPPGAVACAMPSACP